jgi:hypothetical protein
MDWVRLELRIQNSLWISNNQQNIVISFSQDFMASTRNNFFQGQTDRGLSRPVKVGAYPSEAPFKQVLYSRIGPWPYPQTLE